MSDLRDLKNLYENDTCFVIGNGPSLRKFDLFKLIDKKVIVTNCFHMHPVWPYLKHVYHVELNGALWRDTYTTTWKISNLLRNDNCKFIFRKKFEKLYRELNLIPDERMYFLRLISDKFVGDGDYEWDITKGSIWANTGVIEGSMAIAQYMGFKTIYLLGCDATPYIDEKGSADNAYFYNWRETPKVYWPRKGDNRDYLNMIKSWKIISKIFPEHGIRIYNLSKSGNLDMFPSKKFREVV